MQLTNSELNTKVLTRNALYVAIYVALCFVFQPISYGEIQVRIAEALCILPIFDPYAVYSITIGCFISNLVGGGIILDVIFGTFATFIGLYAIKYIKVDNFFIKMLPSILSNTIIIPLVLRYGYGLNNMPLYVSAFFIAIGEIISIYIIGYILYRALIRYDLLNKLF